MARPPSDVIAAIATAPGRGGIGVVRISGPNLSALAATLGGKVPEARVVFQQAFAQDSGKTDSIRDNLKRAIAMTENSIYSEPNEKEEPHRFNLVRRGQGEFVLLSSL